MVPIYVYSALTSDGNEQSGRASAVSVAELKAKLKAEGLIVRRVRQERAGLWPRSRVSSKDILRFTGELVVLLRSGLSLLEALKAAAEDQANRTLSAVAADLVERVNRGESFSSACLQHPTVFDALFVSAAKTGEQTGQLEKLLRNYFDMLEKRVQVRKKVRQALSYPLFLLVAMSGVVGFLLLVIMPRFVSLYADMGESLPAPTRLLLFAVDHLPWVGMTALALLVSLALAVRALLATQQGRLMVDRFRLALPVYGEVARHALCEQIGRSLSMLLQTGTALVPALGIVEEVVPNTELKARLRKVGADVSRGRKLGDALVSSATSTTMPARAC